MAVLNLSIAADADDNSGSTSFGLLSASVLISGQFAGGNIRVFTRFQNLTGITQGSTINSATYSLIAVDTDATTTWNVRIYGNNVDNASNPASGAALDALALTTAFASPTVNLSTTNSTRYNFDVTTVIQEIVNRAGWASGNAVTLLFVNNGSTTSRRWNDFNNGGASLGPQLDIDYTAAVAGGQPAVKRMGGIANAFGGYRYGSGQRRWRHQQDSGPWQQRNGLWLPNNRLIKPDTKLAV